MSGFSSLRTERCAKGPRCRYKHEGASFRAKMILKDGTVWRHHQVKGGLPRNRAELLKSQGGRYPDTPESSSRFSSRNVEYSGILGENESTAVQVNSDSEMCAMN